MPEEESDDLARVRAALAAIESTTRSLQAGLDQKPMADEGVEVRALRLAYLMEAARSLRRHVDDVVVHLGEEAMRRGVPARTLDWTDGLE